MQTSNTSEEMFEYYVNTVQIMDLMREAIIKLRKTMKDVIRIELYAVDREYIVGIGVLSILGYSNNAFWIFYLLFVSPSHHLPHDDLPGEERRDLSPDFLHQRQTEGCSSEEREETGGGFDVKCFS